jgi:guanylate kinase
MRGNLYIVSAPSGSGKTTLLQHIVAKFDHLFFSISYTTRAPRGHEENGIEYFFIDRDEFQEMVDRQEFLESAEYHGNMYGTSRQFVEENMASGRAVILDIDVQGAQQVKDQIEGAVTIFLMPPSFAELERRLKERRLEDDETILRRLAIAKKEILRYNDYDYVVINDKLDESIGLLEAIVLSGSTLPVYQEERIREIIASFGGVD